MATQTYMGIPNDPRLNEDEPTKAMLNGSTQATYEAGIPLSPTLTQRASDIARAEEANAINHELTSRYANAAIMAPVIQNVLAQAQQQPAQQPQIEQQAPVLTQGLLPSLMENNAYQGREMSGAEMAPQEPQTLTQMARKYGQDILDAKQLYAQGEAMGGDQGAQVMALAHSGAERARAGLQQLGVDPAQYGLNGTYDEAAQGLASNDTRAMQNILQGEMAESSGQYYDRIYKILRDQGFSRDIAESEAHRRAQSYASQRVQALNQAFNTYGHNGQVINPMGIQMLGMMAQEDTDMANYYVGRYAGPLQEYAKANQRENAAIQHQYGKEDRADAFSYDVKKMGIAQEQRKELEDIRFKMQEAHANNDINRKFWYQSQILDLQNKYGAKENKNGITHEKAEVARKAITDIDKKLNEDFTLTDEEKKKLRNDRANYQYILDTYFFGGQGDSSNNSNRYGVDVNDYDSLRAAYQQMINENAAREAETDPVKRQANPPRTRAQLEARLRLLGGENNPLVENIIANANYDGDSGDTANQPASTPSQAPASPFLRGVFNLAFPDPRQYAPK